MIPRELDVDWRGALVTLLGACLLAGCPQSAHVSAPADALTAPADVLRMVAEQGARKQRLIVEARISYYGDEGARKAKAIILARRPAAIHVSALSPTDDLVAMLASDGERFTSFQRGSEVCYAGRSCPENVGRFSLFPMEGSQLVNVLFGGVPLIAATGSTMTWDGQAGAYRLDLTGAQQLTQRIWVAHGTGDVRRSEVLRAGVVQISLAFDEFKPVGAERLPHRIDMKVPERNVDLRVTYRDVELNTDVDDGAFAIPCPDGTHTQTLLCYDEQPATDDTPEPVELAPITDDTHGK